MEDGPVLKVCQVDIAVHEENSVCLDDAVEAAKSKVASEQRSKNFRSRSGSRCEKDTPEPKYPKVGLLTFNNKPFSRNVDRPSMVITKSSGVFDRLTDSHRSFVVDRVHARLPVDRVDDPP
jgi:hypothetical protein